MRKQVRRKRPVTEKRIYPSPSQRISTLYAVSKEVLDEKNKL